MATPGKIKALEAETGKPAHETIVDLLNQHGTITNVAAIIGISVPSLLKYIEKNHITKQVSWSHKK